MRRVALAIVALLVLGACNPLLTDPVTVGGELEQTSAGYVGPDDAWLEVAVTGAVGRQVFALALIRGDELHGPTIRSCATGGTVAVCTVTPTDVRMPNQQTVAADGSRSVPLMQVWPDETARVVLVCVDPDTQELGCPSTLRTVLRTVDAQHRTLGSLVPAA